MTNDVATMLELVQRNLELKERVQQLKADLEERTNQYHLAYAKILSREAIIEQLSQEQLAVDVAKAEERVRELEKAIALALEDAESGEGWGPDVTVCAYLKEALKGE